MRWQVVLIVWHRKRSTDSPTLYVFPFRVVPWTWVRPVSVTTTNGAQKPLSQDIKHWWTVMLEMGRRDLLSRIVVILKWTRAVPDSRDRILPYLSAHTQAGGRLTVCG
jgi:hypothetical protein